MHLKKNNFFNLPRNAFNSPFTPLYLIVFIKQHLSRIYIQFERQQTTPTSESHFIGTAAAAVHFIESHLFRWLDACVFFYRAICFVMLSFFAFNSLFQRGRYIICHRIFMLLWWQSLATHSRTWLHQVFAKKRIKKQRNAFFFLLLFAHIVASTQAKLDAHD